MTDKNKPVKVTSNVFFRAVTSYFGLEKESED